MSGIGYMGKRFQPNSGQITADDLNEIVRQLELLSQDRGPGLYCGAGFFPDRGGDDAVESAVRVARVTEPMPPGSDEFPSTTKAVLLGGGGAIQNSLTATSTSVDVVNYSPNLFAPTNGLVFMLPGPISGVWIAIHTAC